MRQTDWAASVVLKRPLWTKAKAGNDDEAINESECVHGWAKKGKRENEAWQAVLGTSINGWVWRRA